MADFGEIRLDRRAFLQESYSLSKEALSQLQLWKLKAGDAVTVSDELGRLFRARVMEMTRTHAELLVFEENAGAGKSSFDITLLQALPEKERMELIIQKTTELGVGRIVPFKSKKSISLEERESGQKKAHRWQEVALKASKQSRSGFITEVYPYCSFDDALKISKDADLKVVLWERQGIKLIKEALTEAREGGKVEKAAVLTGPEGGLEEEEIEKSLATGFIPVSLGRRIMRTETASIIAIGLIRYELEGFFG